MNWPRLTPATHPEGIVLFGVSRPDTVADVTRIAVLMSHFYGAQPVAIHVAGGGIPTWEGSVDLEGERLFELARSEAAALGYPLRSYSEFGRSSAEGMRRAAERLQPCLVVLGQSITRGVAGFARIAEAVAVDSPWPVILTKFPEAEHYRRLLVPLTTPAELPRLQPILSVLGEIVPGPPVLMFLVHAGILESDLERQREELTLLANAMSLAPQLVYRAVHERSPVEAILEERSADDIVIMNSADDRSSPAEFSRTLAEEVAQGTDLPILLVRGDLRRS